MNFPLSCESSEGCKALLTSLKGLDQVADDLATQSRHEMLSLCPAVDLQTPPFNRRMVISCYRGLCRGFCVTLARPGMQSVMGLAQTLGVQSHQVYLSARVTDSRMGFFVELWPCTHCGIPLLSSMILATVTCPAFCRPIVRLPAYSDKTLQTRKSAYKPRRQHKVRR